MSFGTELKDEFDKLCLALRGSVKEETLFNKLVEAFSKVNTDIQVEKIHGRRWCVEFDNTAGNFYWKGKTTRCELGDLPFGEACPHLIPHMTIPNQPYALPLHIDHYPCSCKFH